MFERWTVDGITSEIERQVQGAAPSPRMVRRFYKQGRKHGRRKIDPLTFRGFIVNCVDLAAAELNRQYRVEQRDLSTRLAQLEATQQIHTSGLKADAKKEATPTADAPATPVVTTAWTSAGPDLSETLALLKKQKADALARAEVEKQAIEKRARSDKHDQSLVSASEAKQLLETLAWEFAERVHASHEVGEILWARYRTGYVDGRARRRRSSEDHYDLDETISFDGLAADPSAVPTADKA